MQASQNGRAIAVEIIRQWEGLELKPYKSQEDEGFTVGFGHRMTPAERKKYAAGISEEQAEALLLGDMAKAERAVAKVAVPLNANQEGALISLAFNIGAAAFAGSTAARMANAGEHDKVPAAIKMWNKVTVGGRKVVSKGLKRRRDHEAFVYARPVAPVPKSLTKSRTLAGSLTSGVGTAGTGSIEAVQEVLGEAQGPLSDLALYLDVAKYLLLAVALVGLGLVIYARLSDRRSGNA
jgi:lysozyme